jgi:hypothetical protein
MARDVRRPPVAEGGGVRDPHPTGAGMSERANSPPLPGRSLRQDDCVKSFELCEGFVGGHNLVAAGQGEGGEVGVQPELGRGLRGGGSLCALRLENRAARRPNQSARRRARPRTETKPPCWRAADFRRTPARRWSSTSAAEIAESSGRTARPSASAERTRLALSRGTHAWTTGEGPAAIQSPPGVSRWDNDWPARKVGRATRLHRPCAGGTSDWVGSGPRP